MKTDSFDLYSGEELTALALEHVNSLPPITKAATTTILRKFNSVYIIKIYFSSSRF